MSTKTKNIEEIYQKKTQVEHILIRPDTYIGSTSLDLQQMWVWDDDSSSIIRKNVSFCPGLYKIFDEILVNAADNKHRDPNMTTIKIDIDLIKNSIAIYNDGKGIPIVIHKDEKVYVPTLIFGHLLTSSNFDDTEKKVTGGRNGFGAKLCNIFSKKFVLETASKDQKKKFVQTWENNMYSAQDPQITDFKGLDYTRILFVPDLKRFNMNELDHDFVSLLKRRAYDLAGTIPGVKVYLNGNLLPINNFEQYAALYNKSDTNTQDKSSLYTKVNDRWEICVFPSDGSFQHVSFVNNISTTKGGTHVNYVSNLLSARLIEDAQKKIKSQKIQLRPQHVKQHFWVFINCKIENPSFDSQTKENLTLNEKEFGSNCKFSEKYMKKISELITENVVAWYNIKLQNELNKKGATKKRSRLHGMDKLDDANNAGTSDSMNCTLILTEGDSAKSLAVCGVSVVGRDQYGVFPLRGKVLNIRETTMQNVVKNKEVEAIVKIIGLDFKKNYLEKESLKSLRYGKVMFMTDQDYDGSHIKGLLINFFHFLWPNLIKHNFLLEFITPIVKVFKNKESKAFFTIPEFEEWEKTTPNHKAWTVKYYKGLGTSKDIEVKEYFEDLPKHRINFEYSGPPCDDAIVLAFSKAKADARKRWLDNFQDEHTRRTEFGLSQVYLYQKGTTKVTYCDFVNKELILFSHADNIRSIPSMIDGLKPGQRKVMYTCFRKGIKEVKVFQLAGSVCELAAYHHGEQSLVSTIINLAQDFVGSNNINLLMPEGMFGTRLKGGKDASAPRYISTKLNSITRSIFLPIDDALLNFLAEDNQPVEPSWYCPIIPMVLVNGADGIGTGYATKIPNYNPREIVENIKKMINGEEPIPMIPWYKNFTGTITEISQDRFLVSGRAYIAEKNTVIISELPVRVWTESYKESVLEPLVKHDSTSDSYVLVDYDDHHAHDNINYILKFRPNYLDDKDDAFLCHLLKLNTTILTNQLVLFDSNGRVHRYASVIDILKDFYKVRLEKYIHRKNYMESLLSAELLKLKSQERFIKEKIELKIVIENKKKAEMINILISNKYPSDPVKAFFKNEAINKPTQIQQLENVENIDEEDEDYEYLLGMPLWSLTYERQEKLRLLRQKKMEELESLKKQTPQELWLIDIEAFLKQLDKVEEEEIYIKSASNKKKSKTEKKIRTPARTRELNLTQIYDSKKPITRDTEADENFIECEDPLIQPLKQELFKPSVKKPQANGTASEQDKKRIRKPPVKKDKAKEISEPKTKTKKRALVPKTTDQPRLKKTKVAKDQSDEEISDAPPPPRKLESRSSKTKPKKYHISDEEDSIHTDEDDTNVFVISDGDD